MKLDDCICSIKNHLKDPKLIACICLIILVGFFLIFSIGSSSGNSIEKEVKQILEDDIESPVEIVVLYYNEKNQGCLVEFETAFSYDIAAVHLDTQMVHYNSEYEYYEAKFKRASSASERGRYAQIVLEYSDIVDWKFSLAVNGTNTESGWKQLK